MSTFVPLEALSNYSNFKYRAIISIMIHCLFAANATQITQVYIYISPQFEYGKKRNRCFILSNLLLFRGMCRGRGYFIYNRAIASIEINLIQGFRCFPELFKEIGAQNIIRSSILVIFPVVYCPKHFFDG